MAMPKTEMKPIAAETEKFRRVKNSASTPPAQATGMLKSTMSVFGTLRTEP